MAAGDATGDLPGGRGGAQGAGGAGGAGRRPPRPPAARRWYPPTVQLLGWLLVVWLLVPAALVADVGVSVLFGPGTSPGVLLYPAVALILFVGIPPLGVRLARRAGVRGLEIAFRIAVAVSLVLGVAALVVVLLGILTAPPAPPGRAPATTAAR